MPQNETKRHSISSINHIVSEVPQSDAYMYIHTYIRTYIYIHGFLAHTRLFHYFSSLHPALLSSLSTEDLFQEIVWMHFHGWHFIVPQPARLASPKPNETHVLPLRWALCYCRFNPGRWKWNSSHFCRWELSDCHNSNANKYSIALQGKHVKSTRPII